MKVQRLEKITATYLAWWCGGVSASRLARALGVSREHASRKIMPWARKDLALSAPCGSQYLELSVLPSDKLPPRLATPQALLEMLPGLESCLEGKVDLPNFARVTCLTIAPHDPEIFRDVYRAMMDREALSLSYRAKSGLLTMWFSPHSLVETAHRMHFRGHVTWVGEGEPKAKVDAHPFRDIVPSRIVSIEGSSRDVYIPQTDDHEWNSRQDLTFVLSPDLPDPAREAMIQEWGTEIRETSDGIVLTLRAVRGALAQYVCDALLWRAFQGEMHKVWKLKD